jgi:hypothetical protein
MSGSGVAQKSGVRISATRTQKLSLSTSEQLGTSQLNRQIEFDILQSVQPQVFGPGVAATAVERLELVRVGVAVASCTPRARGRRSSRRGSCRSLG